MTSLFVLFFSTSLWAESPCDDDTLWRYYARATCEYSVSEDNCSSLSLMEGSAAAAAIAAKAEKSPKYARLKSYYDNVKAVSTELARDYRSVLNTYYELKKSSPHPKFDKPIAEFGLEQLREFETQLKSAHPNSLFIKKLEALSGHANDVFQRVNQFAAERTPGFQVKDILTNSFLDILRSDLSRASLIFKQVSAQHGYPENAKLALTSASASQVKKQITERNKVMKQDIEDAKSARAGRQSGRATVGALGVLGSGAVGLALPTLSLEHKKSLIVSCMKSQNLDLTTAEISKLAEIFQSDGLVSKKNHPCERVYLTDQVSESDFFNQMDSPKLQKFICELERQLRQRQDKLDQQVAWHDEECEPGGGTKDKMPNGFMNKKRAVIKTSTGVEVEIQAREDGSWDYTTMRSLNDPQFNLQVLQPKMVYPALLTFNGKTINPAYACQQQDQGREAQTLCEISMTIRTISQVKRFSREACRSKPLRTGLPQQSETSQ